MWAFIVVATGKRCAPVDTYITLISSAGLGGLVPRTVVLPFGKLENMMQHLEEEGKKTDDNNDVILGRSPTKSFVMDSYIRGVIERPPMRARRPRMSPNEKKSTGNEAWSTFRENPEEFNHALNLGGLGAQMELFFRVLEGQRNLMLLRNLDQFDERLDALNKGLSANERAFEAPSDLSVAWIDVWVPFEVPSDALENPLRALAGSDLSLLLQYGHLLSKAHAKSRHSVDVRLRLVQRCDRSSSEEDMEAMQRNLLHLAVEARIPDAGALVVCSPMEGFSLEFATPPSVEAYGDIGKFIAAHSARTVMTFLALPPLPPCARDVVSTERWMRAVDGLLEAMSSPTALCRKGDPMDVLSFAI